MAITNAAKQEACIGAHILPLIMRGVSWQRRCSRMPSSEYESRTYRHEFGR